jgi:hypothetical protein
MDITPHEAQLKVVTIIQDLLTDIASDNDDSTELDLMKDYFGQVADLIVEELGLVVSNISEGRATASIEPPRGWN